MTHVICNLLNQSLLFTDYFTKITPRPQNVHNGFRLDNEWKHFSEDIAELEFRNVIVNFSKEKIHRFITKSSNHSNPFK